MANPLPDTLLDTSTLQEGEEGKCPHKAMYGPLARYVKLGMRMRRECRERFPRDRG